MECRWRGADGLSEPFRKAVALPPGLMLGTKRWTHPGLGEAPLPELSILVRDVAVLALALLALRPRHVAANLRG